MMISLVVFIISAAVASATPYGNKLNTYDLLDTDALDATGFAEIFLNYNENVNNIGLIRRSKRDLAEKCKAMKIASITAGGAANIAAQASSAATSIPFFGAPVAVGAAGVASAGYATQTGLDIAYVVEDCDSIPFNELKDILAARFNKTDEALDRNYQTLKSVSDMVDKTLTVVEKTRLEMNQGFDRVVDHMKNSNIEKTVSGINKFVQYFMDEKYKIKKLPKNKRIAKLEQLNGVLQQLLQYSRPPRADSLHTLLYDIINKKYYLPNNSSDNEIAYSGLYTLYYGTQTYVSVMIFLLEQYSYLADYHYQEGEQEEYNKYLDSIQTFFDDFKYDLQGSGESIGLIDNVFKAINVSMNMKKNANKESDENKQSFPWEPMDEKIGLMKTEIANMKLPLITDIPDNLIKTVDFDESNTSPPLGRWIKGTTVSYAVQYKENGIYSKIGKWIEPIKITNKANPTLIMHVDSKVRTRLIFRKFNKDKPELIGVMENKDQTEFRDIDRDLYNAASSYDKKKNVKEAATLIGNGAKITTKFDHGRSTIHAAAQGGNVDLARRYLLNNHQIDINAKDNNGYTPLHVSADTRQVNFVEFLMGHNADVNAKTNIDLFTPLHLAVDKGFVTVVEALLKSRTVDINAKDAEGFSSLHKAVFRTDELFQMIMSDSRVDVNAKAKDGLTALHLSIIENNIDIFNMLINNDKVDINAKADDNLTPLHYASLTGNLEMVKTLLAKPNIDVNALAKDNMTPLHYATSFRFSDIAVELLNSRNINVNIITTGELKVTPLQIAAGAGLKNVVEKLVNKKVNINVKTEQGFTALDLAVGNGHLDTVEYLIKKTSINGLENAKNTPLLIALKSQKTNVAEYLINNGADVRRKDDENNTPLMIAMKNKNSKIIISLVDKGEDVNFRDRDLNTPILIAVMEGNLQSVIELRNKNGNLEVKNKQGNTPLLIAMKNSYLDIMKYLINGGAEVNTIDKELNTPIIIAIKEGDINFVKFLVLKGADLNSKDKNNKSLSEIATMYGYENIAHYLDDLESAKVNPKSSWFDSAKSGDLDVMRYIADFIGMDVNEMDNMKTTALHYAVEHNHIDVVKYLVSEKYANTRLRDGIYDMTPMESASSLKRTEIYNYLKNN